MTGTSPNRPTQQDHSEYISSLNNTPRILRFQARLADAATNLRSLSQPDDDMYLEPSSPLSASSESTLDKLDHLIDDSASDNPFFTSPSAKQAAIKRRRSIKSAKAIEIEMDPEDSPMRNRSVSRSRRSSTVSSVTSFDDTPSVYPIGSLGEKLASAANDSSAQKRSQRTISGFGSVSRAKRRKLKGRNAVDPKLWTHSQDSIESAVRAEIDEDDSPTFVVKKQTESDSTRRRIRGNKRDSMQVIMGTPVPHHSHAKHRHSRPQDSLDVKLNRLRQTTSATELDLSSHNIVPDSLEEVLQSESFVIRASSQKSIDSIDGDLSSLSQPWADPDTSLTTPESTLEEGDASKLEIDNCAEKDVLSRDSDFGVADSTPAKGSELHIDTKLSPSVQLAQSSPIVDEHISKLEQNPSPSTSYIHQSPLIPDTSSAVESDDTLPYEEASSGASVDDKPAVTSTSVGSTSGHLDKGGEIYPESDDESASSELHGASANKPSSSYLSQLASSMSRFILG
ncbi:hypothetical protein INT44_006856 [Umbelopsis vinacea]|uniref:Uncharacterized protein n=1 Tax=Umbelopsis vinacea TaxID=44442 RepID=A0A8H7UC90_9FUNG|nr:hypothetical protein INT44_006856 [Umbelopsis vinacea]